MTSPLRSLARRGTVVVASLATAALALTVAPASAVAADSTSGSVASANAGINAESDQDYLYNDTPGSISGLPQAGQSLTVDPGVWTPSDAGITYTYQWFSERFEIVGATSATYVPTGEDVGHWLSVDVTATADDFAPVTEEVQVDAPVAPAPSVANVSDPTISGTPQVGATLTANPGTWDRDDATFTYSWETYTEGNQHSTFLAEGPTYVPTAEILGQPVWLSVVASAPGVDDGYASSQSVGPVTAAPVVTPPAAPPAATPVATPVTDVDSSNKPTVQGTKTVGSTLKAKAAAWVPAGATVTYQWLANGKTIKKATKGKLTVTEKLQGKKVSVKVTATSPGSLPVTVVTKVGRIKG